ncbi:hypothetical protein BHM03_00043232 [Ensete ventricosum]|nr:hypothetical protein BHM03_00043232 [Ensete ventricosum]
MGVEGHSSQWLCSKGWSMRVHNRTVGWSVNDPRLVVHHGGIPLVRKCDGRIQRPRVTINKVVGRPREKRHTIAGDMQADDWRIVGETHMHGHTRRWQWWQERQHEN